jgi:hypothetical protein
MLRSARTLVQNYGATNMVPTQKDKTLHLSRRRPHFQTHTQRWKKHKLGQGTRWNLKPRITMLVRASQDIQEEPNEWGNYWELRCWRCGSTCHFWKYCFHKLDKEEDERWWRWDDGCNWNAAADCAHRVRVSRELRLPRTEYSRTNELFAGSVRTSAILGGTVNSDTWETFPRKKWPGPEKWMEELDKKMTGSPLLPPCYAFSVMDKDCYDSLHAERRIGNKSYDYWYRIICD